MKVVIKRVYDEPTANDGYRVLVDRLWPRGIKKQDAQLDEWDKNIAPSNDLRVWFGHDPAKFEEFSARYLDELAGSDEPRLLLKRASGHHTLTLVYAAKDPGVNHARILNEFLQSVR